MAAGMALLATAAVVTYGYAKNRIKKSYTSYRSKIKVYSSELKTKDKKVNVKGRKNWKEKSLPEGYKTGKKLKSHDMDKREILDAAGKRVGELHKEQPEYTYNGDGSKTPTGKVYPDHYHMPTGSKIHYIP